MYALMIHNFSSEKGAIESMETQKNKYDAIKILCEIKTNPDY